MSISSMTGFSRQNGELEFEKISFSWYFELKSVNGKSLEVKVKLPSWLESASQSLKNAAAKYFGRGNVSVYLDMSSSKSSQGAKINEELLSELTLKAIELYSAHPNEMAMPTPGELLALKGVVELEEVKLDDEDVERLQASLISSFEEACKALLKDRKAEGKKLNKVLSDILEKIQATVQSVEKMADKIPAMLRERLETQIQSLKDTAGVSEDRIAQELVMMAMKADVREEIDRLKVHLKTAGELLESKEPVGRRLDFLCQELNREANTTCSKSQDVELTNLGMTLKALIEQFREQIQNVE